MDPKGKYKSYLSRFPVKLEKRTWPERQITKAPIWCSVDLRDGNQALVNPMNLDRKLEYFELLLNIGFREIEIGFPAASAIEFDFARHLIERNLIPEGVAPQVLTQSRAHLIDRTFEALAGCKKAIVHLYNSTSELQRRVVFKSDKAGILNIAVSGVQRIRELAKSCGFEVVLEYSPESFTGTELDFALQVCEAVIDEWQPTPDNKIILNLPATVEMATPNVHADQIEWFSTHIKNRESVLISLHTHNDRGTGVAAVELGLMAGADRVEGTLFGNGERTGNVDLVTVALNLFTQGVRPELDLSDLSRIRRVVERCTQMDIPPRHPYGGDLVFTAFSGSHQDAISKGLRVAGLEEDRGWEVPYLAIDPADIGRKYEPIIRINSQSGKGGVAFIMESEFGFVLPKKMHPEFSAVIQRLSEQKGEEITPQQIWESFAKTYLEAEQPYRFLRFRSKTVEEEEGGDSSELVEAGLLVEVEGKELELCGRGNGPIDACKQALIASGCQSFRLVDFVEHALSSGSDAEAAAYIQIEGPEGQSFYGVGTDANTTKAGIKALLSAVNRAESGKRAVA